MQNNLQSLRDSMIFYPGVDEARYLDKSAIAAPDFGWVYINFCHTLGI
jgi:hypothetical protein